MAAMFRSDLAGPASQLPHFWEHSVGSGHATFALRADWKAQMRRSHGELGFTHVRFLRLSCDDMGTLISEGDTRFYSFFNAGQIVDFLLSIGMKFVEPNLDTFGNANQDEYFKLYRHTAMTIKSADLALRVGGPAIAANAWAVDFIAFCATNQIPAGFISTHHYPTDAFGQPGDDTKAQLSRRRRSVLREQTQEARRQAGCRPIYYTQWCTSSNPRDPRHDEPCAAAFVTKTIMEANELVQGYSYGTFSNIFEENYFPSVPFRGGFGLITIHGIAKPVYRAFQFLHALGTEILAVEGVHPTVDASAIRGAHSATILLTNHAQPPLSVAAIPFEFAARARG